MLGVTPNQPNQSDCMTLVLPSYIQCWERQMERFKRPLCIHLLFVKIDNGCEMHVRCIVEVFPGALCAYQGSLGHHVSLAPEPSFPPELQKQSHWLTSSCSYFLRCSCTLMDSSCVSWQLGQPGSPTCWSSSLPGPGCHILMCKGYVPT